LFTSSEHIDLASTKVFKINNSTVLSSTEVLGKYKVVKVLEKE